MRQGLCITTTRGRDAECIRDALREYGSEAKREGKQWTVCCAASSPDLLEVLTALKACLDANAIAAVKVTMDGRAYAMEGMA
jgi:hypothetical protein